MTLDQSDRYKSRYRQGFGRHAMLPKMVSPRVVGFATIAASIPLYASLHLFVGPFSNKQPIIEIIMVCCVVLLPQYLVRKAFSLLGIQCAVDQSSGSRATITILMTSSISRSGSFKADGSSCSCPSSCSSPASS